MQMTMARAGLLLGLALCMGSLQAREVIPLWGDEEPPFRRAHDLREYEGPCWGVTCAYQVVDPSLTLYLPASGGNDTAVVILPGGGYETEAVYHEGYEIAEALSARGVVAAVLKYRLPNPRTSTQPDKTPLADVRRALQLLRNSQAALGFSARQFGLMGFSAGSHLATVAGIERSADPGQNPDFSILIYGVTRMTPENRKWLEDTLFHRTLTPAEITALTLLERVDENTPPAFLVHALDDQTCHYSESTLYAEALVRNGVEAELHLFARGGHGFGAGRQSDGTGQWIDLAVNWLDRIGKR